MKTYPDGTTTSYGYEPSTSRLKNATDALGQTKTYTYWDDDSLKSIAYSNTVNSTSSVSFSYDPNYPRLCTVGNGYGTYTYSYNPYITDPYGTATTGAGQVSQITNSGLSNSTVGYSYDALGPCDRPDHQRQREFRHMELRRHEPHYQHQQYPGDIHPHLR